MAYNYILQTGVISVDSEDILTEVENEWKTAFGENLNVKASTPQGTMIAAEAINRIGVMKNNADVANMINPNIAKKTFLDGICAFLGIDRGYDLKSTVTGVQVKGSPTVGGNPVSIPTSLRLSDNNGNIWATNSSTQIGSDGSSFLDIIAQSDGQIEAPTTLTIIDGVVGWDSAEIISSSIYTQGQIALTDAQLQNRRLQRLYFLGKTSVGAIMSKANAVKNVVSVSAVENATSDASAVVNGITFTIAGSLWVCVSGGNDQEIADVLFDCHNTGTPWDFGATGMGTPVNPPNGVEVTEAATGNKYYVKFTRPILKDVYVKIDYYQGTATIAQSAIAERMVDFANGDVAGERGYIIGQSVSAFELAGAVASAYPGIYIKSIKVAVVNEGDPAPSDDDFFDEVVLQPYEKANLARGNITVRRLG